MPPEASVCRACLVLVEDDDVDAMAVQRGLRRLDCVHPIERFCDGEQALAFLRGVPSPSEVPLVLLIDINMPRMNGIELLGELRKDGAFDAVEVFVLTTSGHAQDMRAATRLGVAGYVTKDEAGEAYHLVIDALQRASAP